MDTPAISTNVFYWKTSDDLRIFAKDWHVENAKAVVLIIHGLGEHCERYDPMASFFNSKEIGFVGYDRRGHGHSEGKRGHTIGYDAYLDEIVALLKKAENFYPETPIFLYGHSMGANLALNFVLKRKPNIAGLIVTGAWILLQQNPSPLLVAFAKIINNIYPTFTQSNGLDPNNISSVKQEVKKYIDDPLVHNKITSNTGLEMMKAAEFLNSYDGALNVPTLIMHGGADKITNPKGSEAFAKRVNGDITFKEWEGLFHEIHNESKRAEVFEYTLIWIIQILKK